jgi:hypothetical protein
MPKTIKSKLTARAKRYLMKDERQASARYKRLGYNKLARDESSHYRFISRQSTKKR